VILLVQKKKKGGWVYGVESTRKDGSKEIYTGMNKKVAKCKME